MAQVKAEPLTNWEAREDTLAERSLCQPSGLLSACDTAETIDPQQQAPFVAIKGELIPEAYTTVSSPTWHPASLTAVQLPSSDSPAIASDGGFCGHLPKDIATMPYSMPPQSMTLKSSVVGGGPLGLDYGAESLMFNSPMNMSSVMPGSASTAMPTASQSYFGFGSAAATPMAIHASTHSSPTSQHVDLLNHANVSPFDRIPSSAISPMDCAPSFASAMSTPMMSRQQFVIPARNCSSRTDLASELKIDTKPQLTHSKSTNFISHGSGMTTPSNSDGRFGSSDQSGHGLVTQPPLSAGSRADLVFFPSLLYRICMDPSMDHIAYWDEENHVCIPVIENLRVQLNIIGMTANHTDSLQKNFNDYQFSRRTDQRRVRHTTEVAIVKFYNPNFLPGRDDLLPLIVRKSALKKLQNGTSQRDRPSASTSSRKKKRVPSVRTNGQRGARQPATDRANPYLRHGPSEPSQMPGFQIPASPVGHFSYHSAQSPAGQMQPMYHHSHHNSSSEPSSAAMVMPLGVHSMGFGIAPPMSMGDRAESALMSPVTSTPYSHQPFYMEHAPSAFGLHSIMPQSHSGLTPIQSQYTPGFPSGGHSTYSRHQSLQASPQYQPQSAPHSEYPDAYGSNGYHHLSPPSHQQPPYQPQQQQQQTHIPQNHYHLFANSANLSSEHSPPRAVNGGSNLV
ncbi:hypothetical protein GGH95_001116 [Coemansia sp. RSA 1836]|nr:hypothetical protein GGH95_001116 [Coemansia sp. RSA 1836]